MVVHRGHRNDRHSRLRRLLEPVTGLALGIAMLGTIGLSGTVAQEDDVVVSGDAESIVNAIIAQVFAEIFGGEAPADDTADSSGGDINVGGNMGGSVTMGGSGGGITVGDDSGG